MGATTWSRRVSSAAMVRAATLPAVSLDADLEASSTSVRCDDAGPVLAGPRRRRRTMFGGQYLEHRGQHDPMQPAQSPHVTGQQVVLDDPPVLGPVDADDFVVVEAHPFGTMLGFAELEVGGGFGLDHRHG